MPLFPCRRRLFLLHASAFLAAAALLVVGVCSQRISQMASTVGSGKVELYRCGHGAGAWRACMVFLLCGCSVHALVHCAMRPPAMLHAAFMARFLHGRNVQPPVIHGATHRWMYFFSLWPPLWVATRLANNRLFIAVEKMFFMDAIYWLDNVRRTFRRLLFMCLTLPWFQVRGRGTTMPTCNSYAMRQPAAVHAGYLKPGIHLETLLAATPAVQQVIFKLAWCKDEHDCQGKSYVKVCLEGSAPQQQPGWQGEHPTAPLHARQDLRRSVHVHARRRAHGAPMLWALASTHATTATPPWRANTGDKRGVEAGGVPDAVQPRQLSEGPDHQAAVQRLLPHRALKKGQRGA